MTPWNPITSFTSIAAVPGDERPTSSFGTAFDSEYSTSGRPLGFVDVRSEAAVDTASGEPLDDGVAIPGGSVTELPAADELLVADHHPLSWPGGTPETDDVSDGAALADHDEIVLEDAAIVDDEADRENEPQKRSFLKRELSFGRRRAVPSDDAEPSADVTWAVAETDSEPPATVEPALADVDPAGAAGTESVSTDDPAAPIPVAPAPPAPERAKKRSKQQRSGRRVVGLKIGASQIAAAVMVDAEGRQELEQLARTSIPAGMVVDGEVRDAEALTRSLQAFFEENDLPRRGVRIGLASNRIGVRTLDIVGIDDEERFRNAVRFKAHEVLPMAMQESILDYRVVGERVNESGELIHRVLLAVAPRDQVLPYVEAAAAAGVTLAGVDLESLALLRTFVPPRSLNGGPSPDAATVIVNVGHEASTLLVAGNGASEFTRAFDWGGSTLQTAIAQELDVDLGEAATILHHLSLTGSGDRRLEGLDEAARSRAVEAVRSRLAPFARELVSSLQYYQTQPDSLGIEEIVITGGTSALSGLSETLHQIVGVPVRVGDPLARIIVRSTVDLDVVAGHLGSLAVPIGLAVEDLAMRGVNLLPEDHKAGDRTKLTSPRVLVPVAAIAVPLAAVALLFVGARASVSNEKSDLSALEAEYAALPQPTVATIDPSLQGEQATRATTVANVLTTRLAWDVVLNDLSRVIPPTVWLSSLDAQVPNPVAAPAVAPATPPVPGGPAVTATGLTMTGYTYTQAGVARLLARVATLPSLTNVQLQKSEKTKIGKRAVFQFTILADLRPNGGTA